jgi:hypothetical protein
MRLVYLSRVTIGVSFSAVKNAHSYLQDAVGRGFELAVCAL